MSTDSKVAKERVSQLQQLVYGFREANNRTMSLVGHLKGKANILYSIPEGEKEETKITEPVTLVDQLRHELIVAEDNILALQNIYDHLDQAI